MSFVQLTPDLIDQILGFDSSSHKSLPLYLTGNRALQALLIRSVTQVVLKNPFPMIWLTLPSYLIELHSLRSLTITRSSQWLSDDHKILFVLQHLSPSLTELNIDARLPRSLLPGSWEPRSQEAIELPRDGIAPISSIAHIVKRFPTLQTLRLNSRFTVADVSALPPTLTTLRGTICRSVSDINEFSKALPRSLTSLMLYIDRSISSEFISHLPRSLTRFEMQWVYDTLIDAQLLAALPRGLLKFVQNNDIEWTPELAAAYPPLAKATCSITELQPLPPSVTSLYIDMATVDAALLRQLPRTLTRLTATFNWDGVQMVDFPPDLQSLACYGAFSSAAVSVLPRFLHTFTNRSQIDASAFKHFPRSLTNLTIGIGTVDGPLELPPNLVTLSLVRGSNCSEIITSPLPTSITTLALPDCTAQTLLYLPPALRKLSVEEKGILPSEFSFEAPNQVLSDRIEELRKYAPDRNEDFGFSNGRMTIFDLLPRTLVELRISMDNIVPSELSRLPKGLKVVSIPKLPEGSYTYLPMDRLTMINANDLPVSIEDLKRMPQSLSFMVLFNGFNTTADEETIAHSIPPNLDHSLVQLPSYTMLCKERQAALANQNKAEFDRLMKNRPYSTW